MDPSTDGVGTPEAVGSLTWPESAISESPPDTVGSMTDHFAGDPRTNWERMLAGDLYIANDPENARIADRGARLADAYHRAFLNDPASARPLLADLLGELGEGAVIKPPLYVDYGENIHLGARSFVNYNLTARDVAEIRVGTDCQIGPNVQLLTPTHPIAPDLRRDRLEAAEPITIGNDSVIGAGAVVTKDIPAGSIAVGNPACVTGSVYDRKGE